MKLLADIISVCCCLGVVGLLVAKQGRRVAPRIQGCEESPLESGGSVRLDVVMYIVTSAVPKVSVGPVVRVTRSALF